jgi:aminoglycoside/choline kinase family phosphotransferase
MRARGEMVFVHPTAEGCCNAELDGFVVIGENCTIKSGVSLKNCIVLPGSIPEEGLHENCLVGPGFVIPLERRQMGLVADDGTVLIGAGGSDRRYFRVNKEAGSAVLMQCIPGDLDYSRQLDYTRFFRKYGVPVPALQKAEPDNMRALFEDLGDLSLYSWLKCPRDTETIEEMYRQVLDILVLLHTTVAANVDECPLLSGRVFDYDHLRWETGYFMERFVEGYAHTAVRDPSALSEEFRRLALRVDSFSKTVVHRDFQSQNVMIDRAGVPRLIDYQGARMGPPGYDVVSLLRDPYHRLADAVRERLAAYYTGRMESASGGTFDADAFMRTLLYCGLQRHMQALGAYGYLSVVKGKRYFLKHVPEALKLLKEEASAARDDYPELYAFVMELRSGREV